MKADWFDDRLSWARHAHETGQRVIATIGADVPTDLVHAATATCLDLTAPWPGFDRLESDGSPIDSTRLLGVAIDPIATPLLTAILRGELSFVDGIIFSSDREAWVRVFQALRELRRQGWDLPAAHLVDIVHFPRASSREYTSRRVRELARTIEVWTGTHPSAGLSVMLDDVKARTLAWRGLRQASVRLDAYRVREAVAALRCLAPGEAAQSIRELAQASQSDDDHRFRQLALWGSVQISNRLHHQLSVLGWEVTYDFTLGAYAGAHDWATGSVEESNHLSTVADAMWRRHPNATSVTPREHAQAVIEGMDDMHDPHILAVVREYDDALRWDLPMLRDAAASAGIPMAEIDGATRNPNPEVIAHTLAQFEGRS